MHCKYCNSKSLFKTRSSVGYICSICQKQTYIETSTHHCKLQDQIAVDGLLRSSNHNRTLIFSKKSNFSDTLLSILSTNIKIPFIIDESCGDVWLRDVWFETCSKIYVRSKQYSNNKKINLSQMDDPRLLPNTCEYISFLKYYEDPLYYAKYSSNRVIYETLKKIQRLDSYKESIRPLEGGNLFEAINLYGDTWYIIGENTILNELDYALQKGNKDSASSWIRYKKIFQTENVCIIPQFAYHLDLQMSYIGQSTFLINSFDETTAFTQHHGIIDSLKISRDMQQKQAEDCVNQVIRKLEACGFRVIKFCGTLYQYIKTFDPFKMQHVNTVNPSRGLGILSSFINGIDIFYESKYYYLILDSPNEVHKEYFIRFLQALNIVPIFLNMNQCSPEETVHQLNAFGGGLRCQTNWIRNMGYM